MHNNYAVLLKEMWHNKTLCSEFPPMFCLSTSSEWEKDFFQIWSHLETLAIQVRGLLCFFSIHLAAWLVVFILFLFSAPPPPPAPPGRAHYVLPESGPSSQRAGHVWLRLASSRLVSPLHLSCWLHAARHANNAMFIDWFVVQRGANLCCSP